MHALANFNETKETDTDHLHSFLIDVILTENKYLNSVRDSIMYAHFQIQIEEN